MTAGVVGASFRDPGGFVFRRDGDIYRQVNEAGREHLDALMSSGLYEELVDAERLVAHEEVPLGEAAADGAYKVLKPQTIPFVSYPYEWSFGQLRAAALLTLDVLTRALDKGVVLRDASAYNVQFRGTRPVFIDTLSFGRLEEGSPWVGYRQFCQHFLAPLVLMSQVDVRLGQLLRVHLDGIPLDLTARLLPRRTRLRPSLLMHVHAHARSQRRHASSSERHEEASHGFSLRAFRGLVDSLRGAIERLEWEPPPSTWRDYYGEADHYTDAAAAAKERLVADWIAREQPASVWDLGANTGRFSRIAADAGAYTVAFDVDPSAVELHFRDAAARDERRVLPLVLDLTNPSPAIGWGNDERATVADRGPADLALALAVVHHLAIGDNVPLRRVATYLAGLARALIIEFVPKTDPKVEVLLATREDVFADYDAAGFEAAFSDRFEIVESRTIEASQRVLYLMRAR